MESACGLRTDGELSVCDPRQVALGNQQCLLVRSIKARAIDRAGEVSHEHPFTVRVECQADSLHQMGEDDLGLLAIPRWGIHGRSIDGVAARRISAVGPIHDPFFKIDVEIDRFGQTVEKNLDILTRRRVLAFRNFQVGAKYPAFARVVVAFLGPVELAAFNVESNAYAPPSGIAPVGIAMAGLHERFDIRTVQICTHDSHAFAIAPVKLAVPLVELELLGSKSATHGNNGRDVPAVEICAVNGAIVRAGITHVGPVDVTSRGIYNDAVRKFSTLFDDGLQV